METTLIIVGAVILLALIVYTTFLACKKMNLGHEHGHTSRRSSFTSSQSSAAARRRRTRSYGIPVVSNASSSYGPGPPAASAVVDPRYGSVPDTDYNAEPVYTPVCFEQALHDDDPYYHPPPPPPTQSPEQRSGSRALVRAASASSSSAMELEASEGRIPVQRGSSFTSERGSMRRRMASRQGSLSSRHGSRSASRSSSANRGLWAGGTRSQASSRSSSAGRGLLRSTSRGPGPNQSRSVFDTTSVRGPAGSGSPNDGRSRPSRHGTDAQEQLSRHGTDAPEPGLRRSRGSRGGTDAGVLDLLPPVPLSSANADRPMRRSKEAVTYSKVQRQFTPLPDVREDVEDTYFPQHASRK